MQGNLRFIRVDLCVVATHSSGCSSRACRQQFLRRNILLIQPELRLDNGCCVSETESGIARDATAGGASLRLLGCRPDASCRPTCRLYHWVTTDGCKAELRADRGPKSTTVPHCRLQVHFGPRSVCMNTGVVAATLEAQQNGQLARLLLAEVAIPDSPDMGRLWRGSGAAVVGFHSTEHVPHHPPRSQVTQSMSASRSAGWIHGIA